MTTNNTWRDADHEVVIEIYAGLANLAMRRRDDANEAFSLGDSANETVNIQRCSAILDAITVLAAARANKDHK